MILSCICAVWRHHNQYKRFINALAGLVHVLVYLSTYNLSVRHHALPQDAGSAGSVKNVHVLVVDWDAVFVIKKNGGRFHSSGFQATWKPCKTHTCKVLKNILKANVGITSLPAHQFVLIDSNLVCHLLISHQHGHHFCRTWSLSKARDKHQEVGGHHLRSWCYYCLKARHGGPALQGHCYACHGCGGWSINILLFEELDTEMGTWEHFRWSIVGHQPFVLRREAAGHPSAWKCLIQKDFAQLF